MTKLIYPTMVTLHSFLGTSYLVDFFLIYITLGRASDVKKKIKMKQQRGVDSRLLKMDDCFSLLRLSLSGVVSFNNKRGKSPTVNRCIAAIEEDSSFHSCGLSLFFALFPRPSSVAFDGKRFFSLYIHRLHFT